MNSYFVDMLTSLSARKQRVRVTWDYTIHGFNGQAQRSGYVSSLSDDHFVLAVPKGRSVHAHAIHEPQVMRIEATTKCRSKKDLKRYGDYRVFYTRPEVRLTAQGDFDLTATLRAYLSAP